MLDFMSSNEKPYVCKSHLPGEKERSIYGEVHVGLRVIIYLSLQYRLCFYCCWFFETEKLCSPGCL